MESFLQLHVMQSLPIGFRQEHCGDGRGWEVHGASGSCVEKDIVCRTSKASRQTSLSETAPLMTEPMSSQYASTSGQAGLTKDVITLPHWTT